MLQRLPFELQERIVSLLDVHDVVALTETDAFNHLFTLITNVHDPPEFFTHANLRCVHLEEYMKSDDQGLITLVELKVSDANKLDTDDFYDRLSLSTNFVVALRFHYEKECGLMFGPTERGLKLYDDKFTLSRLLSRIPKSTHILLTNQIAFDFQLPIKPDLSRLTVENAAMVTLLNYNRCDTPNLIELDELCLKDPTDLDPLSGLTILSREGSAPSLVVDSKNDSFPFQITAQRAIYSSRMFLSNVLFLENLDFFGTSLRLEMVGSILQETPSFKSINAPDTKRLALLIDTEDLDVEDIDFPALTDLQIATSAETRNFLHLDFAHHFKLNNLVHLEILGAVISSTFFLEHINGFDSLQELGFLVEDHHMALLQSDDGYGCFPALKKLSLLVVFGLDCKGKTWVPKMDAPNLTSFAMEFHYSRANSTYSTKDLFNSLQNFDNLTKLDLTFIGDQLTDVSTSLKKMCDRIKSLRLSGVCVNVFANRDVTFSKLENLCLCGSMPDILEFQVVVGFDAPVLTNLCIYSWRSIDIIEIREFPSLVEIRVRDMMLDQLQLDHLPSLKRLSSGCFLQNISSSGLPELERLVYLPSDPSGPEDTLCIENMPSHVNITVAALHDYALLRDRLDVEWPMNITHDD